MKIVFASGADPQSKIGGAELQSWLLARELGKEHDVTFLVLRTDFESNKEHRRDGIKVIGLTRKKKLSRAELTAIARVVTELSPDVVHLRAYDYVAAFAAISRLRQIPVVYHVSHVYDCRVLLGTGVGSGVRRQWRHMVNRFGMNRLAGLVCQTEEQKRLLYKAGPPLAVICNSAAPPAEGDVEKDERLVLWVGNIKPIKQPLMFADLAESFKDTPMQFRMIGYPQDEALAHAVIERAHRLSNLEFIPGLPFRDVERHYRRASLLVNTSEEEGFSNTFIQAMQACTPILSLKVDPDGILTRYRVGYCAGEWEGLKDALQRLRGSPEALEAMRANFVTCVRDNFRVEENAKKLERFFARILQERGGLGVGGDKRSEAPGM